MTSKRKKTSKQHRPRARSSVQQVLDVQDASDDTTVVRSDGEGSVDKVFSTEEFSDPIDLADFEEDLRERMLVAAPMLMGRDAEYGSDFFTRVVGLCDKGPHLKDVAKCYGFISDDEIGAVWKTGMSKGRYEFSRCEDDRQLKMFGQQYFKVYGNRPHNNYFCLRFLRACFASFVYGKQVNWCAEALDRHQMRLKSACRNPSKLGPVATRCQVEGLCRIIKELSHSGSAVAQPGHQGRQLKAALELEQLKMAALQSAEDRLHNTRQRYNASLERMRGESLESVEEDLNDKYSSKLKEARQILRREGATVLYKTTIAESEELFKDLAYMRDVDAQIRQTVVELEVQMGNEATTLAEIKEELELCKKAVRVAREEMLILKTPRVFEYPLIQSIPPLGLPGNDSCAYCGLGFIWKAAILSSCGCFLHPPCAAEMILLQNYRCVICKDVLLAMSPLHLAEPWVAQFGGELNSRQEAECTSFKEVVMAAKDSIQGQAVNGLKN